MDKEKLETIRNIAIKHVQRCMSSCPSSATCRHRRKRGKSRENEPCTQELTNFTRFVEEVMQGGKDGTDPQKGVHDPAAATKYAFDLTQAAVKAALLDLEIDRCSQRKAAYEASIHKAMKAKNFGSSTVMRYASALRAEVRLSMTLIERQQKLIDKCQNIRSEIYKTYSPGDVSLAELMKKILEAAQVPLCDCQKEKMKALEGQPPWVRYEDLQLDEQTDKNTDESAKIEEAAKKSAKTAEADEKCFFPEATETTDKLTETAINTDQQDPNDTFNTDEPPAEDPTAHDTSTTKKPNDSRGPTEKDTNPDKASPTEDPPHHSSSNEIASHQNSKETDQSRRSHSESGNPTQKKPVRVRTLLAGVPP